MVASAMSANCGIKGATALDKLKGFSGPQDSYGFLRIPKDSYGIPMDSYGFLRIPMDSCRIPMDS
jgi:hypothetical protein